MFLCLEVSYLLRSIWAGFNLEILDSPTKIKNKKPKETVTFIICFSARYVPVFIC